MYIVEIEPGVWLAPWQGDPGRTLVESSAKEYPSARSAFSAIARACMYRNFDKAVIHPFHVAQQPQGAIPPEQTAPRAADVVKHKTRKV